MSELIGGGEEPGVTELADSGGIRGKNKGTANL
jgi:hypothetical protein